MTEEQKIEIIMSIPAYSAGNWTPEECYQYYYFLITECECQSQKTDLKVVKKDGRTNTH
mgnify:CR=1 FL=1